RPRDQPHRASPRPPHNRHTLPKSKRPKKKNSSPSSDAWFALVVSGIVNRKGTPRMTPRSFTGVLVVSNGRRMMRLMGRRLPILAMTILVLCCAPALSQEVLYLETADWVPTASVLAVPTSYVAASTYVIPTSYAVPSLYATAYRTESTFVEPTTYLAPSYYET